MNPSRYSAPSATTACDDSPGMATCPASVPPMNPASCKAYTTPPKNPYTNTGFVPWSRDDWAHWIIMSMMVTLYAAYKTAASQRA